MAAVREATSGRDFVGTHALRLLALVATDTEKLVIEIGRHENADVLPVEREVDFALKAGDLIEPHPIGGPAFQAGNDVVDLEEGWIGTYEPAVGAHVKAGG